MLALAACSGSGSTQAASPSETAPAPESSTPEDTAPQDETTPEPPADDDAPDGDDPAPAAGDAACLEGTWIYRASEVEDTFAEMMANVPESPIETVSVEGDSRMTFDGSTIRQEYDPPQVMTIDAASSAIDMQMEFTWSGHTAGQYVVEGDMFRITSIDTSDFNVVTRVLVDGKEMDGLGDLGLGELIGETGNTLPEGQVEFACSGDTLRLTAVAPHDDDFRFDYELVRE